MEKLNRTLFIRDNLEVLRGLPDKSVDLIYIDPPFNSNKNYSAPIGSKAAGANFKDVWHLSDTKDAWWGELSDKNPKLYEVIHAAGLVNGDKDKAYLIYMAMRLLELHRILKGAGSIYFHCDQTMSHSIKLVMDAVFGKKNFKNEIVWKRVSGTGKTSQHKSKNYGRSSDAILFYSKSALCYFEEDNIKAEYPKEYKEKRFKWKDSKGVYERISPFRGQTLGDRPNLCYKYKGFQNPRPSGWRTLKKKLIEMDKAGDVEIAGNKIYRKQRPGKGLPVNNMWTDILQSLGKERLGYPTQKPLALLERIIKASCPPDGMVLDPFCGCATACIAAEKLGRKWIGIDLSSKAGDLFKARAKTELEGQLKLFPIKLKIRKDLPVKHAPRPSKNIKHQLYGEQKGYCNGCGHHFEFRHFHKDHIVPLSKGGQNTDSNLQLLCGHCNAVKGGETMAYLKAALKREGILRDSR